MKTRPKTGEKRRVNQPLKIDRLPGAMHDRIQAERAKGRSWERIEEDSPKWSEWKDVPGDVVRLFPKLRLPHSNLQRWWDIRVEQARKEILAETESARTIADAFKQRGFSGADEAVMNAIRDMVFTIARSASAKDQTNMLAALLDFGTLITKFKRLDIAKEKLGIEREKLSLVSMKIKGLKSEVEKKKLSNEELKQKLDEIYGLAS